VTVFYERLWNAWDDTAVSAVLANEFRFRGSLGTETSGVEEWRAYRDMIRMGSNDFQNEIVDLVVSRDEAAARLLYSGTYSEEMLGVPATGRRFSYSGAAFFKQVGGLLCEAWVLGDLENLRRQLA
jgi:steroid delta-isomerase-like uncharacterized protein